MALSSFFKKISWNLDILGSLKNHQTLSVIGDKLEFETRFFPKLQRWASGDGREKIQYIIQETIQNISELLQSYQHSTYILKTNLLSDDEQNVANEIIHNLQSLIGKKENVILGLKTLSAFKRYEGDLSVQINIQTNIDEFTKSIGQADMICSNYIQNIVNSSTFVEFKSPKIHHSPYQFIKPVKLPSPELKLSSPQSHIFDNSKLSPDINKNEIGTVLNSMKNTVKQQNTTKQKKNKKK
jgi:hypothetical protein